MLLIYFAKMDPQRVIDKKEQVKKILKDFPLFLYCFSSLISILIRTSVTVSLTPCSFPLSVFYFGRASSRAGFEKIKLFPLLPGISETIIALARGK